MKDKKVENVVSDKTKQSTLLKNEHGGAGFSASTENKNLFNFMGGEDNVEEAPRGDGRRGGRGGRGRGGEDRGGQRERGGRR